MIVGCRSAVIVLSRAACTSAMSIDEQRTVHQNGVRDALLRVLSLAWISTPTSGAFSPGDDAPSSPHSYLLSCPSMSFIKND